jgi:hypothetical protein
MPVGKPRCHPAFWEQVDHGGREDYSCPSNGRIGFFNFLPFEGPYQSLLLTDASLVLFRLLGLQSRRSALYLISVHAQRGTYAHGALGASF